MLFSKLAPALGALVGLAQASPAPFNAVNGVTVVPLNAARQGDLEVRTIKPCVFSTAKSWQHETLFEGICGAGKNGGPPERLGLHLPKAAVSGDIQVAMMDKFLAEPTVRLDLGGLEAYFEVEIDASASLYQTVELMASGRLDLGVPGLSQVKVGAAFALDLVVGVSAAVDVKAGFYVKFPKGCFAEISTVEQKIVRHSFEGLIAKPIQPEVGAHVDLSVAVELDLGLRLRAAVGLDASVGLKGLDIGVGAGVAVWVNLFSCTHTLVKTSTCPVQVEEKFALSAGVALKVDVSLGECLKLELAPVVFVTLYTAESVAICCPLRHPGSGSGSGNGPIHGSSSSLVAFPSAGSGTGLAPVPVATATGSDAGLAPIPVATNTGSGAGDNSLPFKTITSDLPAKTVAPDASTDGSSATAPVDGHADISSSRAPVNVTGASATTAKAGLPTGGSAISAPVNAATTMPANATNGLVTSTVRTTKTYTITSCVASVPNCPASLTQKIVTSTVIATTTVCPATMTAATSAPASSTTATMTAVVPVPTVSVTTVTLTTCPVPVTSTFTPPPNCPTPEPTVTITDDVPAETKTRTHHMSKPVAGTGFPVPTGGDYSAPTPAGPYPTGKPAPPAGSAASGSGGLPIPPKATVPVSPVAAGAGRAVFGGFAMVLPALAILL
ncbi:hypothetical protein RB595_006154 [Gaeumannomyces hyphopodioides]